MAEMSDNFRCLRAARGSLRDPLAWASPHSLPSLRLHWQTRAVVNVGAPWSLAEMKQNIMENEERKKEKVYIIESPSSNDLLYEKLEGNALKNALFLAGIEIEYYLATDEDTFIQAFDNIESDIVERSKNAIFSNPFIHISAHGNKEGIGLTNREFISWVELEHQLNKINENPVLQCEDDEIGFFSSITLCLSTCLGLYAEKLVSDDKPSPFAVLIASNEKVSWADSLTGFITFYHHMIFHDEGGQDAVEAMKTAARNNSFDFVFGKEMKALVDKKRSK
ncbi:hypothetical protein ACQV5M_18675 [Leptospira sp. SA-E8]|uniref:hypothetical protein n=1 Tax=Leptospira sp. SA-E8 TaxID=3422259 RepID=UPI003EB97B77